MLLSIGEEKNSPRPGIEPGPSTWQAEILTTRLSRNRCGHLVFCRSHCWTPAKTSVKISFEPDLNQRPMDFWCRTTTVHRSTNWAIEGLVTFILIPARVLQVWLYFDLELKCQNKVCYTFPLGIFSNKTGGVAQMVERSLSMREVPGSIPGASK